MNYETFLQQKQKSVIKSGFDADQLNPNLMPFQEFCVRRALRSGKHALFADTGLGKTIMQLEWAHINTCTACRQYEAFKVLIGEYYGWPTFVLNINRLNNKVMKVMVW